MLFNEPKLLKWQSEWYGGPGDGSFSALQRAEIAEIRIWCGAQKAAEARFSALQRAEIAEIRQR